LNLIDRILNRQQNLAEPTSSRKRPDLNSEIGVSGDFSALYNREEARKDAVTVADYRKMLDNDGTVEAIYNLLTLPIKSASYHFEVEAGGKAELQLVQDNFERPPHRGGMSLPFDLLLADMLRGIAEGFRLYEKVWTISDGKIVYKKLGPRDSTTVTLKRDDNGGFAGAQQKTWNGLKYIDVAIPVERCFLFTYAKEREFLYGRSAFKSAHYHYDRKHKLYYLQQLGGEVAAVPGKKMTVPDSVMEDANKRERALDAANNFGGIDSAILLGESWGLEEYKSTPVDLQKAIDHHDTLIARSVLAQFLVLAGSGSGSYSLGESDKENFLQALQGVMKQIEQHINHFLIPDLINFNFGSGIYPEFKFEDISANTKKVMSEAFNEIIKRQDLPSYIVQGIAKQVGEELGIDTEEGTDEIDEDKEDSDDDKEEPIESEHENSDGAGSIDLADSKYSRKPTAAEKRVHLLDLSKKLESAEQRLTSTAESFFIALKDDTAKRVTTMLSKGGIGDLKDFTLGSFTPYRKALEDAMMEQYLLGKRTAADEVSGKIPQTPKQSRDYIRQQAKAVADKQEADLTFSVKAEITKEARTAKLSESRELGITDILARLAAVFASFVDTSVTTGIAVSLAGAVNLGRQDSFGVSSDIDRMQYSAILDGRTTDMCRALDNSVVSYEEYKATPWKPPVHFNCRSIWVAVLKDDSFKPAFRKIPAAPGGHTAPQI